MKFAKLFAAETKVKAELIVEDFNSLMNSRLLVGEEKNVNVRLMDFEYTDFNDAEFDVVYSQGGISNPRSWWLPPGPSRAVLPGAGILARVWPGLPHFSGRPGAGAHRPG